MSLTFRNQNKYQQSSAPIAAQSSIYDSEYTPYVARPDQLQMKKKRLQEQEKAYSSQKFQEMYFAKLTANNSPTRSLNPIEESLNERDEEFNQAIQNFQINDARPKQQLQFNTPNNQPSQKFRNNAGGIYASQGIQDSPRSSNPLMGESEGEYRKRLIMSEYKDYMRHQQEFQGQHTLEPKASMGDLNFQSYQGSPLGMSKRQSLYLQKKMEAEGKPQVYEPNIYATKQRYKYSLQGKPSHQQINTQNLMQTIHDYSNSPKRQEGYILKTDPMKQLLDKELQKQEYSRALREQMQLNTERKQNENQIKRRQDDKLDREIQDYYSKLSQQTMSENLFKKYDQIPAVVQSQKKGVNHDIEQNNSGQQETLAMMDEYEQQVKARERQREEWREQLRIQKEQQEEAKIAIKNRKVEEDVRDEQRLIRQIEEINASTDRSPKKGLQSMHRQSFQPSIQASSPKQLSKKTSTVRLSILDSKQKRASLDKRDQPINEEDQEQQNQEDQEPEYGSKEYIEAIEKTILLERNARATEQALAKLDQMQEDLVARHKQNHNESVDFFKDLFVQSKHILTNSKFQSPMDGFDLKTDPMLEFLPLQFQQRLLPTTSANYESDFLLLKQREHESKFLTNKSNGNAVIKEQQYNLMSMTDEIDSILTQFNQL